MESAGLLFASLVAFLASGVLAWLGWVVWMRAASSPGAGLASAMFSLWWYALALRSMVEGASNLLAAAADPPLSLLVGLQFVNLVAVCVGLAGLLSYLVFLYTGRPVWFWPLTLGYAIYAGVLIRSTMEWEPTGVVASQWETSLVYARPASEASTIVLLVLLIGPQVLAALSLFALSPRLPRSASRVRLLVVATAILLWFGSTFLANAAGFSSHPTWELLDLFIPLLVAGCVLLVYRPPRWLRRFMPPELPAGNASQVRHPAGARRP